MNIFKIHDGRAAFWQWDLNRKLAVGDDVCGEVHFCNGTTDCSLVREIYELDGARVVDVPNILLQTARNFSVYAYVKAADGDYTKRAAIFPVRPRSKPADYVYTETEAKTWEQLDERIQANTEAIEQMQMNGGGGGGDAVAQFFYLTLTKNADGTFTPDMTRQEVFEAIQSGRPGYCLLQDFPPLFIPAVSVWAGAVVFEAVYQNESIRVEYGLNDNVSPAIDNIITITRTSLLDSATPGKDGKDGEDGGYYTPAVSQTDENTMQVSFTASKEGMAAVADKNITLPVGNDGKDGITPHIGGNGNWFIGETDTGKPSRGADGTPGKDGTDGQDGYTPQKGVDYFDGADGKDGTNGQDGHTPVRGTDYWTDEDKEEIKKYVKESSTLGTATIAAESFTSGYYVRGSDGTLASFTKWSASEFVDISLYQGMDCVVYSYLNDRGGFAFYDENQTYIAGVNGNDATVTEPGWIEYPITIPVNARYICYTIRNQDGYTGYIAVKLTTQYLANKVEELDMRIAEKATPYAYALTKTLCIGDSLTNGAYYSPDRTDLQVGIIQDYPYFLGKMLHSEVTNAGSNGAKASTWWTNKSGNYDFTQYDSFIIWLGTNAGFTDTLDTDVTPYGENYADFAETETGYLCKIIQKILTDNPSCFIAIGTIFASNDSVPTSNTLINKVAEKYGLTVVDFSDLTSANYPKLHNEITNVHFNKAGNIYIANRIVETINAALNADPMRCEFGMTAQQ